MELVIEGLSKTYPNGVRALDAVSLRIGPGMFGLLGPNGAGKSTLMRTIATLQPADAGSIRFGDIDVLREPARVRERLGYLPQDFGLYPTLSAHATLDHFTALKGVADSGERKALVEALLQQVNLWEHRKKAVGGFSGGMRQRLGIAIALAGKPQLLIVDEPTAGLDPTERNRFLNLLGEIGDEVVIILSTHIVDDVRELCRHMAIINRGRVVLSGDPEAVITSLQGRLWRRSVRKADLAAVRTAHTIISERLVGGTPVVHAVADASPGEGWASVAPDLEDVYFNTVGADAAAA